MDLYFLIVGGGKSSSKIGIICSISFTDRSSKRVGLRGVRKNIKIFGYIKNIL